MTQQEMSILKRTPTVFGKAIIYKPVGLS